MRRKRPSIPLVVGTILVTVTTVMLIALGVGTYIRQRDLDYGRLQGQMSVVASALSVSLALPVWNLDRTQIDRVVDQLEPAFQVQAISVNAAGVSLTHARNSRGDFVPTTSAVNPAGLLTAKRFITLNGQTLGTVEVFVTPKYIEQDLQSILTRTLWAILLVGLLLSIFVYLALWILVMEPLRKIEQYATAVTSGEPTEPLDLDDAKTSDVEVLQRSIERMVHLQESLRRSETMAAMGTMVGGVAHEIRNPLFAMTALLDAYEDELARPDLEEFAQPFRDQVARLTSLTRELLDYGRPIQLDASPQPMPELIELVANNRNDGIPIETRVDQPLPLVRMDRNRLQQAFDNLVDNALRFSPPGKTVMISAKSESGFVECSIEDQGPGIDDDALPHVFEPFYSRRPGGVGLGLWIVQRIVEEHNGTVVAGNRPNGGAKMTVRLPVA